jgi:hypothetical protein
LVVREELNGEGMAEDGELFLHQGEYGFGGFSVEENRLTGFGMALPVAEGEKLNVHPAWVEGVGKGDFRAVDAVEDVEHGRG